MVWRGFSRATKRAARVVGGEWTGPMDALAGYGSGSESDSGADAPAPAPAPAPAHAPAPARARLGAGVRGGAAGLLSRLPAPKGAGAPAPSSQTPAKPVVGAHAPAATRVAVGDSEAVVKVDVPLLDEEDEEDADGGAAAPAPFDARALLAQQGEGQRQRPVGASCLGGAVLGAGVGTGGKRSLLGDDDDGYVMKRARVSDDGAGAAPAADSAPGAGTHSGAEQQDYSAEWAAYYAAHGYPQYQGQGAQYATGEASQHQHQQQQPDPAFAGATGKDAELLAALGADNVVEVNAASMRAGRSASGAGR